MVWTSGAAKANGGRGYDCFDSYSAGRGLISIE